MKRVFAVILMIMLAVTGSVGCAQEIRTRENTVVIGGIEEKITETMYVSPSGFTLWYPADMFAVAQDNENECITPVNAADGACYLMIVPVEIPVEEADAFIHEATGGYMEGEAEISEIQEGQLDSGLDVKSVQAVTAEEYHRYYLITGKGRVFCVTAIFPLEAAEGFGARMEQIIATFDVVTSE